MKGISLPRLTILSDNLNPVSPTGDCAQMAANLKQTGHEVQLIPYEGGLRLESIRRVRRAVRDFQPHQIICVGHCSIEAGPAIAVGRRASLTAIHTSTDQLLNQFHGWGQRLGLNRFDQHLIRDELKLEKVRAHFPHWRTSVMPWTRPAAILKSQSAEIKRQLNIPPHARLVGTTADLVPRNRIKDFMWGGDLTCCIRDDVYWLVLGEGPHEWRLRRFASQLQVGGNVRFLGWPANADQIIASLDVYVQPSTFNDSCIGMSTALAQGIPLVGIIDPLHCQFIRHGHNGFLVERGARNEIARCVNRLVNEPAIAQEFSGKGIEIGKEVLTHMNAGMNCLFADNDMKRPQQIPA